MFDPLNPPSLIFFGAHTYIHAQKFIYFLTKCSKFIIEEICDFFF